MATFVELIEFQYGECILSIVIEASWKTHKLMQKNNFTAQQRVELSSPLPSPLEDVLQGFST